MQERDSSADHYLLGDDSRAIQRLLLLGQIYEPITRRVFAEAGITTGMRVLDVGCGPGDVSLIAADLVGETGHVLGVDDSPDMARVAAARTRAAGLAHVSFVTGDLRDLALDQQFDVLVGRFILMHLAEPETVLRRLLQYVRPGGIVVFQEYELSNHEGSSYPFSALWEWARRLATIPWQQAGGNVHAGMGLPATFQAAGLTTPHIRYEAAIGADADWQGFAMLAEDVRMLLPLIAQFGLATEEEIAIDTLEQRLREEIVGQGGVARLPDVVSAWAHTNA